MFLTLLAGLQGEAQAFWWKKKIKQEEKKEEKLTPYQKLFKDKKAETVKGLMTMHKVGDKIYAEFPLHLLGRDMMLTSSIVNTSDGGEGVAGQFGGRPLRVIFTRQDSVVQVRFTLLSKPVNTSGDPGIERNLDISNRPGIFKTFKILASTPDSSAVVIDLKELFFESSVYTDPFPASAANGLYGFVSREHKFLPERSFLRGLKAFADNVVVTCEFCFSVDHKVFGAFEIYRDVPLTATVDKILLLLPEEPMRPRIADSRIGVDPILKTDFAHEKTGVKSLRYVKRWNIIPKDEALHRRGGLTEPEKPIVFYMDTLIPFSWKKYIKAGAEEWNAAFEKIGLKNVVRVVDFPRDDSTFDAYNIRNSVIRYSPLWMPMVQTSMQYDARSGEILNASVYLHGNVITTDYFNRAGATMAADPRVRSALLPEDIQGDMLRLQITKAVGTCLGLTENRGASYAYPVDSLRSASFTREYGLSPSIMDDIVYNYIAQPEDVKKGVRLTPKGIGPYDEYVIKWLYSPVYEAASPKEELPVLDRWIREQEKEPYGRYARRQPYFEVDPSALTGDLGDDHIRAMQYMLKNVRYSLEHFFEWYGDDDRNIALRSRLYRDLTDMFTSQVYRVLTYAGGMYIRDVREGYDRLSYEPVDKARQREAVAYVMRLAKNLSWLEPEELHEIFEIGDPFLEKCRFEIFNALFSRLEYVEVCAQKSGDPYTADEFMEDIYRTVWEGTLGNRDLDAVEMELQTAFLNSLIEVSSVVAPAGKFKSGKGNALAYRGGEEFSLQALRSLENRLKQEGSLSFTDRLLIQRQAEVEGYSPLAPLRTDQSAIPARYFGWLHKTRSLLRKAVVTARKDTRLHYEFLLYKIGKALDNK